MRVGKLGMIGTLRITLLAAAVLGVLSLLASITNTIVKIPYMVRVISS